MILRELGHHLGCTVEGDGDVEILRMAPLSDAGPGDLTFVVGSKYADLLKQTRAAAVIRPASLPSPLPSLLSENPYLSFARAVTLLHAPERPAPGIHPTAVVDATATLGEDVHVGAYAVVGPRVQVGARSALHAHVVLYADVEVGEDCLLHSGVHVRERCRLGHRVVLQNGAVIGADGFGFARDAEGRYEKIPQVGVVVIEDDVEIGALSAVDRAALSETRIGRGTKIDNLVQVGHSVQIGNDSIVCSQVGIAGSSKVGHHVTLAGQVGVADHIHIGDRVIATAQTGVGSNVEDGAVVSGSPAVGHVTWLRASALFAKLPDLLRRVRDLERRVVADK